jgi:hypothetical protein
MRSRRDQLLDHAIASGKFGEARRAHWAAQYDRNPAGTEQALAVMVGVGGKPPYPPELFPELQRPRQRSERGAVLAVVNPSTEPPPPQSFASDAHVTPEQVKAWSQQLFPEAVPEGASFGRITRAHD